MSREKRVEHEQKEKRKEEDPQVKVYGRAGRRRRKEAGSFGTCMASSRR